MWHARDPGPPCTAAGHDRAPIRRPVCPEGFSIARTRSQAKLCPDTHPEWGERTAPVSPAEQTRRSSHARRCSPSRAQLSAQVRHACRVVPSRPESRLIRPREGRIRTSPAMRRRGNWFPGDPRRRRRRGALEPSDLEPVAEIRSQTDQIWTLRSESNG